MLLYSMTAHNISVKFKNFINLWLFFSLAIGVVKLAYVMKMNVEHLISSYIAN